MKERAHTLSLVVLPLSVRRIGERAKRSTAKRASPTSLPFGFGAEDEVWRESSLDRA